MVGVERKVVQVEKPADNTRTQNISFEKGILLQTAPAEPQNATVV